MLTKLFEIPNHQLEHYPQDKAFTMKLDGKWVSISTKRYIQKINQISLGLLALGIKKGDKIALISNNRTQWCILDMALLQIGAISVPVYPNIADKDYIYIFNHAKVQYCFVSDEELFSKIKPIQTEVRSLKDIYSFDQVDNVKHWNDLLELGKENIGLQEELNKRKKNANEDDVVTIIYTSGTTGRPKGVMLSHKNMMFVILNSLDRVPIDKKNKVLSFLPICHSFERFIIYLYQYLGVQIYFAESMETIAENIKEIKPHLITAVPRVLEKVYDKIMLKGKELSGIKKIFFFWAVNLGERYDNFGKNRMFYNLKLFIARKLVFKKWKEALGGNIYTIVVASAPLQLKIAKIFTAAGMTILEGYGLSETSPVVTVNTQVLKDHLMLGSVGKPIKNIDVKIAKDGEILVKGENVMKGYYKDKEQQQKVIKDGYLHTGDIGEFTSQGFIKITGRKKEIFKTSGGKYISPQVLESTLKQSPFIEQIMVMGEGEKMPSALIQLNFIFVKNWAKIKNILLGKSFEEIIQNKNVINRIAKEVNKYNEEFGSWERIKVFELTPDIWSINNGLLTPTLKVKRKNLLTKYSDLYQKIYVNS